MKPVEYRAETVEEAIRSAQADLGAYDDEIEVSVKEKGSKGFLGIFGSKESVIEVTLLDKHWERKLHDFLKGILKSFDEETFSEVKLVGRTYRVKIEGEEVARLIGKHGKTVAALQHILNIYANRMAPTKVNVTVDIGDYRLERKRLVEEIAHRTAKSALTKKIKIVMEPMFAFERRLVHEVVSQYEDLKSYSVGFEPYRKVVVEYSERKFSYDRRSDSKRRRYDNVRQNSDRQSA
ncbi:MULTISPECIES: RNA-binding cell elongation regulator Jag/EloR [unclassified Mesotoga]|uniref:RNA-binding cell elongation regulator Jag/EloR n=1 Tax=unclassified Mesotoga TaxID=1184398 RepID=UPI000EF21FA3|nr:RNA-binding cell elongation regulator Jag/EloR [Mesotoga sp. BH458_6_3_2_1]MDI9367282.1 RNA-binding cell elongation regulator Jag/EloR [Thermotogota bacterium]RLL87641.1 single-stranded DNA-binding protein [Mesotoga sp. BH458_6_3_2_1]